MRPVRFSSFFFFNDTATTEIYTLSLHDALPIYQVDSKVNWYATRKLNITGTFGYLKYDDRVDRKSTRLNSSHVRISYAVFCLKKKKDEVPAAAKPSIEEPTSIETTVASHTRQDI